MAYDVARGVTVLFGGNAGSDVGNTETWEWNGTAWTQRLVSGPSARHYHAMSYDAARRVTVLFGGISTGTGNAETWELGVPCSPSITTQPSPQSACPSGTAAFSVVAGGTGPFAYQWQIQTAPNIWAALGIDPLPLPCGGSAHATPPDAAATQIGITPCSGITAYQVRCIVSNACGSITSNEATYSICYANCDCSTVSPILNVNDFQCFLNKYAAGDPYANCDDSTVPPILNVNDFQCFLNKYAAGCP
jgi:hypothetical protein